MDARDPCQSTYALCNPVSAGRCAFESCEGFAKITQGSPVSVRDGNKLDVWCVHADSIGDDGPGLHAEKVRCPCLSRQQESP